MSTVQNSKNREDNLLTLEAALKVIQKYNGASWKQTEAINGSHTYLGSEDIDIWITSHARNNIQQFATLIDGWVPDLVQYIAGRAPRLAASNQKVTIDSMTNKLLKLTANHGDESLNIVVRDPGLATKLRYL
jgi:hypothetical protein